MYIGGYTNEVSLATWSANPIFLDLDLYKIYSPSPSDNTNSHLVTFCSAIIEMKSFKVFPLLGPVPSAPWCTITFEFIYTKLILHFDFEINRLS